MKVIIMCSSLAHQVALANQISMKVDTLKIITTKSPKNIKKNRKVLLNFISKIILRIIGYPIIKAWRDMQTYYSQKYPVFIQSPVLVVEDINDPAVHALIVEFMPDLVIVSGTNLLKKSLIITINKTARIMNLHTGISPYIKGGPNCTNWCLSLGKFGLIGNTIMWLDAGIDSGNIITTERTQLTGSETLTELHLKVMLHAHDLYMRSIIRFIEGKPLPNVPQKKIGKGQVFYSKNWNIYQTILAILKHRLYYARQMKQQQKIKINLVPLGK